MEIWLVQTGEIIPLNENDRIMRTANLGFELANRGHQVIWWASAFEHQRKKWVAINKAEVKLKNNLTIKLLRGIAYKRNISIRRFIDHLIISRNFAKEANKLPKPDIIVNSLPEHNLAYKVLKYAEKNNIPVITDLRDYWPDFILTFFNNKYLKKLLSIFLYRDFYRSRYVLKNSDVLVSMMEYMLKWGQTVSNRANTDNDEVFYLGSPRLPQNANKNIKKFFYNFIEEIEHSFNVIYIGTFTDIHNPISIIEAARILQNKHEDVNINYIFAGTGNLLEVMKKKAKNIKNVHFTGWLDKFEIATLLKKCNIGIIPIHSQEHFFPNKVFSYFSAGLPVISSAKGELELLIEQKQLGYNYKFNDSEKLSEIICKCYKKPNQLSKISDNVTALFNKELNTDVIYKNYADMIEKCFTNKPD